MDSAGKTQNAAVKVPPRPVKNATKPSWGRWDFSSWASQGQGAPSQIILKAEYKGSVVEVSVLKNSTYNLCALKSKVSLYIAILSLVCDSCVAVERC